MMLWSCIPVFLIFEVYDLKLISNYDMCSLFIHCWLLGKKYDFVPSNGKVSVMVVFELLKTRCLCLPDKNTVYSQTFVGPFELDISNAAGVNALSMPVVVLESLVALNKFNKRGEVREMSKGKPSKTGINLVEVNVKHFSSKKQPFKILKCVS